MSRWSKVPRSMWQDPRFRELSAAAPCAQLLYLRLLTGPENTTLPGLFAAWASGLAESLRWPVKGFHEAFRELSAKGFAEANWELGIVWLPRAIDVNRPDNPNVIKGWRSAWDEIPDCDLKSKAFSRMSAVIAEMGDAFAKAFAEGFAKPSAEPLGNGLSNQEQEQEQEREQEQEFALTRVEPATSQKKSRKKADTPAPASDASAEEVERWLAKWGIPSNDPEALNFVEHAREKDRRCADWGAAFRRWKRNGHALARPKRNTGHQAPPPEGSVWDSALDDGGGTSR
jgi:hypothetical protein